MDRRPASIVHPGRSARGRLTRGLALLVLALTAFPFTAPYPVCDLSTVIRHPVGAGAVAVRLDTASRPQVSRAPSRAGESSVPGEEAADHDVLPVDAVTDAGPGLATRLESGIVRPAQPRLAAFLRAAPLRL